MSDDIELSDFDLADFFIDSEMQNQDRSVYLKREVSGFQPAWTIYDSNGKKIAQTNSYDAALVIARQSELDVQTLQ